MSLHITRRFDRYQVTSVLKGTYLTVYLCHYAGTSRGSLAQ